jgi:hypothetical protein
MAKLRMTYTAMNTDDVTELLNWVIDKRLIAERSDGSQFINPLNNKLVGEVRKKIEGYTLGQFRSAELFNPCVTHRNEWETTNCGCDFDFMMELNDNG